MFDEQESSNKSYGYPVVGILLLFLLTGLALFSSRYVVSGHLITLNGTLLFIGFQVVAGAVYLALYYTWPGSVRNSLLLLLFVFLAGLGLRGASFFFSPVLEDDYYRFLWDGAVTAHGLNPYRYSPEDVRKGGAEETLPMEWHVLKQQGEEILEETNAQNLRTIYPPVAQGVFALAHVLAPWETTGLRVVYLLFDFAGFVVLLLLLRELGLPLFYGIIYWLNPLVIRTIYNALHMDVLLFPLLLLAVMLAKKRYLFWALFVLLLATGVKIWPIVLVPFFLFHGFRSGREPVLSYVPVFSMLLFLLFFPMLVEPLQSDAGWMAYGRYWRTNTGLFGLMRIGVKPVLEAAGWSSMAPGLGARGGTFLVLGGIFSVLFARFTRSTSGVMELVESNLWMIFWVFMFLPAQFPWYALWFLPFLTLRPKGPLLLVFVLVPIYDGVFYFIQNDMQDLYETWIVWLQWGPVLLWLGVDFISTAFREWIETREKEKY